MTDTGKTRREKLAEAGASTRLPYTAYAALNSSGHIFNEEQQQRLVDTIANDPRRLFVALTLKEVPQLTENQRKQLTEALPPPPP